MKQKLYLILTLAAVAINFACSASNETVAATTDGAPAAQTKPATATIKMNTPTETGELLFNAIRARDKAAVKQLMSKDSLEMLELAAQEKKMTFDELLEKQLFVNVTLPDKLEQRSEKITGDKASLEMLSDTGEWTPLNFVKENGGWKVTLG